MAEAFNVVVHRSRVGTEPVARNLSASKYREENPERAKFFSRTEVVYCIPALAQSQPYHHAPPQQHNLPWVLSTCHNKLLAQERTRTPQDSW